MANAEKTFEQGVAVGMLLAKSSNSNSNTKDQLLNYVLQNATVVATCQHTTDYSVKIYYGTIDYHDPNLNLFVKEFKDTNESLYVKYVKAGFLSDNINEKDYGPVAIYNWFDKGGFIPYVAKILYKKDTALFGDLQTYDSPGIIPACSYIKIYNVPDPLDSSLEITPKIEKICVYNDIKFIHKPPSYIDDYKIIPEHKFKTNAKGITAITSTVPYAYDSNGNKTNIAVIYVPVICDEIHYRIKRPMYNDFIEDMSKEPNEIIITNKYYDQTEYRFTVYHTSLPNPDLMGDLNLEDLQDIYYEYESQIWSEATPKGYTPYVVEAKHVSLSYPT